MATLALSRPALRRRLWAYRDRMLDLKNDKRFRYVLIFKNHGEAAGASLEHPHSQLIALPIVPRRVREEVDNCWHYYDEKERCIFCDIIRQERDTGERVVGENEHFISIAPYASRFPFEMWLLPKVHGSSFENNQSSIYSSLARMLKDSLMRLDAVLDRPAYNFMIHTSRWVRKSTITTTGTSNSSPNSPRLRDLSGAPVSTSIRHHLRKQRAFYAKRASPKLVLTEKK